MSDSTPENKTRLNVLILCKDYPPSNLIGGKRPNAWFKYLPEFGVDLTVVTATLNPGEEKIDGLYRVDCGLEVMEAVDKQVFPKVLIRKTRSFFELWLPFLFPATSRYYPIFKKAIGLMETNDFDCIIATGEPFVLFRFGADLSDRFSIPWIPDYRDNWSNSPKISPKSQNKRFRGFYRRVERKLLSRTKHVITVGNETSDRIKMITATNTVHVIENGHDIPMDFKLPPLTSNHLIISHIGRLYRHRSPKLFFSGVSEWLSEGKQVSFEIQFIGLEDFPNQKREMMQEAGSLSKFCVTTPSMPYDQMLELAAKSHVFLYLSDPAFPLTSGKIYDYLGLGRPIIAVSGDSFVNEIIEKEKCGYIGTNPSDIKKILNHLKSNLTNNDIFETGLTREIYSRRAGTKLLAKVISETCRDGQ